MSRARAIAVGLAVLVVSALTGLVGSTALFGGSGGERGDPDTPGRLSALPGGTGKDGGATNFDPEALQKVPKGASIVARAPGRSVRVYREPGARPRTLKARRFEGQRLPLVFLVKQRRRGWVQAYLPTRPNLSTGWLKRGDVELRITRYQIKIQLDRHRLTLYKGGKAMMRTKIATGRAVSPTPTGRYYVTDLIRPPNPRGFYGPYALGLSAHSPVYTSYAGGNGQVGVHGTNRPSVLGTDVSHGCIRVANRVITRLAKRVPLGTPVDIARS